MEREFCYICGTKIEKKAPRCWFCPFCKQDYYDNPRPCSDLVIFNDKGEVLLCKRALEPNKGLWDLPGGFIEYDETAEAAAIREAEEELGVSLTDLNHPQYVMSYAGEYPWGKETYKIFSVVFVTKANKELTITPQDDVADTKWIRPDDIDTSEMSSPKFKDYIKEAYAILKS